MPCPMPYSPISRVLSSSLREQAGAGRRELLRPHHDPLAVLHLLHLGEIVPVVVRPVEAEAAADRLDLVLPEPLGQYLVVEALGRSHRRLEHLPGRVRARGLRVDVRVGDAGLGRALVIERGESRGGWVVQERRVAAEGTPRAGQLRRRAPGPWTR